MLERLRFPRRMPKLLERSRLQPTLPTAIVTLRLWRGCCLRILLFLEF